VSNQTISDQDKNYNIILKSESETIIFEGSMRMPFIELERNILPYLMKFIDNSTHHITIELKNLLYLNSLGISNLIVLLMEIHKRKLKLTIHLSRNYPWQIKISDNLSLAHPEVNLIYND